MGARTMRTEIVVTAVIGIMSAVGCGAPEHLTHDYGVAYRDAFRSQVAQRDERRSPVEAPLGLNSQEAAIIAESYQRSLAGRDANRAATEPQVMIIGPSPSNAGGKK